LHPLSADRGGLTNRHRRINVALRVENATANNWRHNNDSWGINMKALVRMFFGSSLLAASLAAQAQEELPVLPTEIYICNFAGTSDMDDMMGAMDEFNAWADAAGIDDLTIFLLTPNYYSDELDYDLVGLNIWPDGAAWGSGSDKIGADPDALAPFEGIVDCQGHALYALVGVKPPTTPVADGGLFEFSNCTLEGNRDGNEGIGAVAAASQLFSQWNLSDAHAAMFNLAGLSSDTDYDFKWVTYYPSYGTYGSLFDHIVGENQIDTLNNMLNPIMACDSSRIYSTSVIRMAAEEQP
jgi:hypothetical protein